jgi:hypothetical protein
VGVKLVALLIVPDPSCVQSIPALFVAEASETVKEVFTQVSAGEPALAVGSAITLSKLICSVLEQPSEVV